MSAPIPQHSAAFRVRRVLNWFPLALAYAFLYMGRYNLTVAKNALGDALPKSEFGFIFLVGSVVYGCAFVVNGPLTDRIGGRRTMLIGVLGALVANILMGVSLYGQTHWQWGLPMVPMFTVLYALNMYFQSFGAVAIVTVKAPWFHVRERGTLSTIFGVMIASGVYFAFDWGAAVVAATRAVPGQVPWFGRMVQVLFGLGDAGIDQNWWIFFTPAIFMGVLWLVLLAFLRDRPSEAGFADFETGEGSVSADGERLPVKVIFLKLFQHPVLRIVCLIELCSGVLRNGVMHWYPIFAKEVGFSKTFWITDNWGLALFISGVAGSFLTGWASDRFFGSRRAPMAAVLYGLMILGTVAMGLGLEANYWVMGTAVMLVSMSVIGVHGILSGTSTVDFGGAKNAGAAVGIVDGVVYLGSAIQSGVIGAITPTGPAQKDPALWWMWPWFLVPFAVLGTFFATQIWHAMPSKKSGHG